MLSSGALAIHLGLFLSSRLVRFLRGAERGRRGRVLGGHAVGS